MFSLSEMIFLAILALLLIGPKQLPEVARNIARFINEMRRSSSSLFADFEESKKKITGESLNLKEQIKKQVVENVLETPKKNPEDKNV